MPGVKTTVQTWRLIDSGPGAGAHNMAVDEELLEQAAKGEAFPTLRLYTWNPPAVSIGRFQKVERAVDIDACRRLGLDLVRRITGGRAVLHNHELTYSVVARTDNPLFPQDVLGAYRVIASGLLAGLKNLGIQAEVVSRSGRHAALVKKDSKDPSCFSSPSWYEILVNGKKIIGSAQRRIPGAFLQHGSILIKYEPHLEAEVIPGAEGGPVLPQRTQSAQSSKKSLIAHGTEQKDVVTCIGRELGREAPLDEVKQAFVKGFAEALGLMFR